MLRALLRARAAPIAAAAAATTAACALCEELPSRFVDLPSELEDQRFVPAVRYGAWDRDWDRCNLSTKQVAGALDHAWPIQDYADAIRQLLREHTKKSEKEIEKIVKSAQKADTLEQTYKRRYLDHAFGGAVTRHIILVRHGQYDEQRAFVRSVDRQRDYGMPLDETFPMVDARQVLTPLGRRQAEATGVKLAEKLAPALSTPGREGDVRIHVSTLTRAKETADIIASYLPLHVRRLTPDPNLAEGWPAAHRIPFPKGAPEREARDVHVEGARIEAAFRSLFYRGKPPTKPKGEPAEGASAAATPVVDADAIAPPAVPKPAEPPLPRHEYDIVVCHGNVIRYFVLRALQLPPEAWLRLCTFNCSLAHIMISPTGGVALVSVGDTGHLSLEESTFSMHQGYEW